MICPRCLGRMMRTIDAGFPEDGCVQCGHRVYYDRAGNLLAPLSLELDLVPVSGTGRERGVVRAVKRSAISRSGKIKL